MSSESANKDSKNFVGMILRTNGKVESYTYTGYKSIRDAVGGMIECVTTGVMDGERWDLWGNEEGRLLELPMNQVAREFIAKATLSPLSSILSLHGDFLLLGVDDEGDSIAAPNEIAALAAECAMFDEPVTRFIVYDDDGNIVSDTEHGIYTLLVCQSEKETPKLGAVYRQSKPHRRK